ncbi:alpha/beta fold hydrolase [Nocardia sp. NPDC088792]|uniref:alpha/beta fold hydrolase n=1 Tax=Nocardia sp. NPDC088792 TaxID=3364332 RepID=UPI0037FDE1E1
MSTYEKTSTNVSGSTPSLDVLRMGSGPGLVLAHGAGGDILSNFGPILPGLSENFTVVGPNFPGSGGSSGANSRLDLDSLADSLVASGVQCGLDSFALLGYSMGAPVAVRAAARHPTRVTALVLTAGFAYANPRMRLAVGIWKEILSSGDLEKLSSYLFLLGVGAQFADRLSEDQLRGILSLAEKSSPPGAKDQLELIDRIDVRDDLESISVPTLVISTQYDFLVSPGHHHELTELIPQAQMVEIASGHFVYAERSTEWFETIQGFLGSVY